MGNQYIFKKKVLKLGKSRAITLPPIWLKANAIQTGDIVAIEVLPDKLIISVDE